MAEIDYQRWTGTVADAADPLLALCTAVFGTFDPAYLRGRVPHIADADLWLAIDQGEWVGFKLGYRRGEGLLYSWLGGVDPRMRGQGVASELMRRQHDHAAAAGYRFVETSTRAANNPMILLNLRHGFHVAGFEIDARGIAVVIQRKELKLDRA
ncbi:GNAT superfamily N-acetyltransferase [Sphingomonas naasensis]|uniref:GNAT family N-acetyltransferase n=1 Tax=Sphingomonas naasensis TaxID=1344951 RepID=A0A4S1WR67_9SPHN|nr:GNAT family N-acetyltransferase [Sphingomonas naasensis]NIJ18613.1 GNAT superfamily N-acetyltransferase [Sphingomonas naasensis]TGX45861.1 GNAT family N-acetyltransferase [Sphingomonas naasensis]